MFKIMIIEDDLKMREIILGNIVKWGFEGHIVQDSNKVFDDFVNVESILL